MKQLFFQAVTFIGISGIGWLLDFCTYTVLSLFSRNLFVNNIVSSWLGVTFTFCFSTRGVFKNQGIIPLKVKYAMYMVYQFVLILLISWLLKGIDAWLVRSLCSERIAKSSFLIAKLLVTPITVILNFFVMKLLVERLGGSDKKAQTDKL